MDPLVRALASGNRRSRETLAQRGDKIADIRSMLVFWDWDANGDADPARIGAQAMGEYWWICRNHEAGNPDESWPGHTLRWKQRAAKRAEAQTCSFCTGQWTCPRSCLRGTDPQLASPDVWDYITNDPTGVTPDNNLHGSKKVVSWLCTGMRAIRHSPWKSEGAEARPECPECRKIDGKEKRAKTARERARLRKVMADEARANKAKKSDVEFLAETEAELEQRAQGMLIAIQIDDDPF